MQRHLEVFMKWLLIFLPLFAWGKPRPDDFLVLDCANSYAGLFATMNYVVGALDLYERGTFRGLTVNFGKGGLYYDSAVGSNWWNYYFEPIYLPTKKKQTPRIMTLREADQSLRSGLKMTRMRAYEILHRYVRPLPHIQNQINAFAATYFQDKTVVGVHYRGTDKKAEAPRVPYEKIYEAIDALEFQDFLLFVATDEAAFLAEISARYPGRVVAAEAMRSTDGSPLHFNTSHQYQVGEEAVIDCLLLSRCDLLIRTPSFLSLYTTYFNPHMPVLLIENSFSSL